MPMVPAGSTGDATELERAAAELQAFSDAQEACARSLDELEAIIDVLLDDSHWCVLVLDHDLRIRAASRGMADDLGLGAAVVGKMLADVAPASWHALVGALPDVVADRWTEVELGAGDGGELIARRWRPAPTSLRSTSSASSRRADQAGGSATLRTWPRWPCRPCGPLDAEVVVGDLTDARNEARPAGTS